MRKIQSPTHVAFVSYGNDSIALLQWLHENLVLPGRAVEMLVVHNNTGWASPAWPARVAAGEAVAIKYGFKVARTESEGLVQLTRRKKSWPSNQHQFCTTELKILPTQKFLDEIDPEKEVICLNGVRREESRERSAWPEWTEESERHGGRHLWSPLVRVLEPERDALIQRAGFEALPHGSQECYPCINANKADLRGLSAARVAEIEALETSMGFTSNGKPRTMFRPHRYRGAVGIREMQKWAESGRGEYEAPSRGCDSGFCGT
jgi:3'-phosphoadenosine 5'-phosphosulfate sulfotransferase (PAPS reductase)/FAD synthetase